MLSGADFMTGPDRCTINWTSGIITARGEALVSLTPAGAPVDYYDGTPTSINGARVQSYERARENAMENLMGTIRHLRIDPDTRLSDLISDSPYARKRISSVLAGLSRIKKIPASFDGARCEIRLGMGDIIASLPGEFPRQDFPTFDDPPLATDYTGLIIDGRGLDLKPMVFPSVYKEDGLEIYGRQFVDSVYAARHGMVSYCYDDDDARRHPRAGRRPYYTVALKNLNGCPVIADRDARKILSGGETRNNLQKCRLILILDREARQ